MAAQLELRLQGPLDQLQLCWQAGATLLESVPFAEDADAVRYQILLALQEMVTNVLRHAYELDETLPIVVRFAVDDEAFTIELRDQGPPFDPLQHDLTELLHDESMPTAAGGFGIHIARLVMDQLHYERRDGWNVLRLAKLVHACEPKE
jgi:serine/threonine-protein kinase RsbW